jgi:hypothetical protein
MPTSKRFAASCSEDREQAIQPHRAGGWITVLSLPGAVCAFEHPTGDRCVSALSFCYALATLS